MVVNLNVRNSEGYKAIVAFVLIAMGIYVMWSNEVKQDDIAFLISLLLFAAGSFLSLHFILRTNVTQFAKIAVALIMSLAAIIIILSVVFASTHTLMMYILAGAASYMFLTELGLVIALCFGNVELRIEN